MKIIPSVLLMSCLLLPLAACTQDDAKPTRSQRAPVPVPASEERGEWAAYVQDTVGRNLGNIVNQPYVYFLPGESAEDFDGQYERMADKIKTDLMRGIVRGNMLAYASPASNRLADMVVEGFEGVPEGTMKGVRVLFIGKLDDGERVRVAAAPSGADYVFVDTGS